MNRAIVIVMDGCGAGEAPDAPAFGDHDHPNTLGHVCERHPDLVAPHLQSFGLFAAAGVVDRPADHSIEGFSSRYGRLREVSVGGKDSVTGHWEMMGIVTEHPFPTYPQGFPPELIREFEAKIGRSVLGNKPASGTAIIAELGAEHMDSGAPIVYTSADSVFQIAAHESVIAVDELYRYCEVARGLCVEPNNVQRVIARPFTGAPGSFTRTERRKDFPLAAPDNLIDHIGDVFGIGVVPELFAHRGFRSGPRTQNNHEHILRLQEGMAGDARFIFANFEDFDMLYGHRNDADGFARCLTEFDAMLAGVLAELKDGDLLILTADHGNDPTDVSTDHTREYVPAVVIERGPGVRENFGDLDGMTCIGATVARHLEVSWHRGTPLDA